MLEGALVEVAFRGACGILGGRVWLLLRLRRRECAVSLEAGEEDGGEGGFARGLLLVAREA